MSEARKGKKMNEMKIIQRERQEGKRKLINGREQCTENRRKREINEIEVN